MTAFSRTASLLYLLAFGFRFQHHTGERVSNPAFNKESNNTRNLIPHKYRNRILILSGEMNGESHESNIRTQIVKISSELSKAIGIALGLLGRSIARLPLIKDKRLFYRYCWNVRISPLQKAENIDMAKYRYHRYRLLKIV